MRYTWDPAKHERNLAERGIGFDEVTAVFDGPTVEREDDRFDYGEVRIQAIGLVHGIEFTVVYTDRDEDTRHIITAWRSTPNERRFYWEKVEGFGLEEGDRLGTPPPHGRGGDHGRHRPGPRRRSRR